MFIGFNLLGSEVLLSRFILFYMRGNRYGFIIKYFYSGNYI